MKKICLLLLLMFHWAIPAVAGVNVITGNLSHSQELLSVAGGPLPLSIELYYNSLDPTVGTLGRGWTHSYDITLHQNSDDPENSNDGALVMTGGAEKHFYYPQSDGTYKARTGDYSTLVCDIPAISISPCTVTLRNGFKYKFSGDKKLVAMVDRYGNQVAFDRSSPDQTIVRDPSGRSAVLHYTGGKVDWMRDPEGHQYDFSYDANGMLERVEYPAPSAESTRPTWEYKYFSNTFLRLVKDPEDHITKYNYGQKRVQTCNPSCGPWHVIATVVGSMVSPEGVLDMNGTLSADAELHTTHYSTGYSSMADYYPNLWDSYSATVTEKDDGETTYQFDGEKGQIYSITDPVGNKTSYYFYTSGAWNGLRMQITTPFIETPSSDGGTDRTSYVTTFVSYDPYGNPTEVTGHVRRLHYNAQGTPTLDVGEPHDQHLRYEYSSFDRVKKITNLIDGNVTIIDYRLLAGGEEEVTITAPMINLGDTIGPQTILLYRLDGQLDLVTDPLGRQIDYDYTANGLLRSATDLSTGIVSSFSELDNMGRPHKVTVAATGQTRVSHIDYDNLGRVTAVTRDGSVDPQTQQTLTYVTSFGYDFLGNRTTVIDAENRTTGYDYNYRGQVMRITDALNRITELLYSGAGCASCGAGVDQLVVLKDAKQQQSEFSYYLTGKLKSESDPLGKTLVFGYDADGRLTEKRFDLNDDKTLDAGDQRLLSFSYSGDGKLLSKTDHVTNETTTFSYYPLPTAPATDPKAGRLWTVGNAAASYTFDYFANGWLKSVSDGNGRTVEYLYDAAGRRELVTIKQGATVLQNLDYVYDPTSKELVDIVSSLAGTFHFAPDAWGRRDSLTYPNGVHADYDYHPDQDWLTSVAYPELGLSIAYPEHDKVGNRKQRSEDGVATDYDYDATYQLTQAKTGAAEENFVYDAVGNRESGPTVKETAANSYSHDAANRMTQGRQYTYEYDARGNQAKRIMGDGKEWQYSWDGENRLIEAKLVKSGATLRTVTFKYDPFGRRIEKRVEGLAPQVPVPLTTTYVYDGEDIALEYVNDGTTTTSTHYVHGPGIDEPLALVRGGQSYFYHADGLGSIVALSDSQKQIVQRYRYESFGQVTASDPAFANTYTYTGREWDPETGLYYYRARYYDAMEGRFISKDPIGFAGGDVNVYRYVLNNPQNRIDPSGLKDWFIIVEGEFAKFLGVDRSAGIVLDDDDIGESGVFYSSGNAMGETAGFGIGAGVVKEIQGSSINVDVNYGLYSVTTSYDDSGFIGGAGTIGIGGGTAISETYTSTYSLNDLVEYLDGLPLNTYLKGIFNDRPCP